MKKNSSYLDMIMEWKVKRILIALALVFIVIVIPIYMFNAEPYDFESEKNSAIQEEEIIVNSQLPEKIETKDLIGDTNPIENFENKGERNTAENTMPPASVSVENERSGQDLNYIYNTTENKDRPSAKMRTDTVEKWADGKTERALSYEELSEEAIVDRQAKTDLYDEASLINKKNGESEIESKKDIANDEEVAISEVTPRVEKKTERERLYNELSQDININKQAEIESKKNNSSINSDNVIPESKIDNSIAVADKEELDKLNRIEAIESVAKEKTAKEKLDKLLSSNKQIGEPEIKSMDESELKDTDSIGVKNIKVDKNKKKVSDINSQIGILKEKKPVDKIKYSTNLSAKNKISRALLATRLVDKEPVDIIKPPVIVNKNIMTKLYYFTEILNMNGEVLYHYWMWDGKIEFEKEIKIWGNRWRASTLKMIPYSKTGIWQVRLVNEDGDILNETQFEVIKE